MQKRLNKIPSLSMYETVIVDQINIKFIFRLMFRYPKKPLKVMWLEYRAKAFLNFRIKQMKMLNAKFRGWLKGVMKYLFPDVEIVDFAIGPYPREIDRSGLISYQFLEDLYAEWQFKYPVMYKRLRDAFYGDNDIYIAQKKWICSVIENLLNKVFSCDAYGKNEKTLLCISESENIYLLNYILGHPLMRETSFSFDLYTAPLSFSRKLVYVMNAFTLNTLVIFYLVLDPLMGKIEWKKKNKQKEAIIALTNHYTTTRWQKNDLSTKMWGDITFLVDDVTIKLEDLVIFCDRYVEGDKILYQDDYEKAGLRFFKLRDTKMSWSMYKKEVLGKFGLFLSCIWAGPLCFERMMAASYVHKLVYTLVRWSAFFDQVKFKIFLDVEEHSWPHVVYTVICRHFGAYTGFLPHGVIQRSFSEKFYLCYSTYFMLGKHMALAYGHTWGQDAVIDYVGNIKNDSIRACQLGVYNRLYAKEFEDLIIKLRRENKKIVSLFPSSMGPDAYITQRYKSFMLLAAKLMAEYDDLVIILKNKHWNAQWKDLIYNLCYSFLEPYIKSGQLVLISEKGISCSVQAAALASDISITMSAGDQGVGSSWLETVMMGKPALGYDLPETSFTTPLFELFYGTVILRNDEDLIKAVRDIFNGTWENPVWPLCKEAFDPFCDQRGIDRMRRSILEIKADPEKYFSQKEKLSDLLKTKDDFILRNTIGTVPSIKTN